MDLKIIPETPFKEKDFENLKKIILIAEKLLKENNISIPTKIYFYNSFEKFIEKVLPEVENYNFNEKVSREIIRCALNNGTYGTINFEENAIVEMNFNPFKKGFYPTLEFLELLIHEAVHLHLYKKLNKDINSLKFRFNKERFIGNEKIILFDEGYTKFMTNRILTNFDKTKIQNIVIPRAFKEKPEYKPIIDNINVDEFDKNFENLILVNQERGFEIFKNEFGNNSNKEEILNFAIKELKKFI
jgi:hypothetical protein